MAEHVGLVSGVQKSHSGVRLLIFIPFQILFPQREPCVYVNPILQIYPSPTYLVAVNLVSKSLGLFLFCKFFCIVFIGCHALVISYHICLSLSGLASVSMIISRSIHVAAHGVISFFFMAE